MNEGYIKPRGAGSKDVEIGTCAECRWWVRLRNPDLTMLDFGLCHSAPPLLDINPAYANGQTTRWPYTDLSDFCGEFKQRESE